MSIYIKSLCIIVLHKYLRIFIKNVIAATFSFRNVMAQIIQYYVEGVTKLGLVIQHNVTVYFLWLLNKKMEYFLLREQKQGIYDVYRPYILWVKVISPDYFSTLFWWHNISLKENVMCGKFPQINFTPQRIAPDVQINSPTTDTLAKNSPFQKMKYPSGQPLTKNWLSRKKKRLLLDCYKWAKLNEKIIL